MNNPEIDAVAQREIDELWRQSSQPAASPREAVEGLANNEHQMIAIAHLHLLMQFATGAPTPSTLNEPAQRYNAVLAYLMTGNCTPAPNLAGTVDAIHKALIESLTLPQ